MSEQSQSSNPALNNDSEDNVTLEIGLPDSVHAGDVLDVPLVVSINEESKYNLFVAFVIPQSGEMVQNSLAGVRYRLGEQLPPGRTSESHDNKRYAVFQKLLFITPGTYKIQINALKRSDTGEGLEIGRGVLTDDIHVVEDNVDATPGLLTDQQSALVDRLSVVRDSDQRPESVPSPPTIEDSSYDETSF